MQQKLSLSTFLILAIFTLAGVGIIVGAPNFFSSLGESQPPAGLFVTVGLGIIILLSLTVYALSRTQNTISTNTAITFIVCLGLVALVKFTIAPLNAYQNNDLSHFQIPTGSEAYFNQPTFYITEAIFIMIAYLAVLGGIYLYYYTRARNRIWKLDNEKNVPPDTSADRITRIVVGSFLVGTFGLGAAFIFALVFASTYVGIIGGAGLAICLMLAIASAFFMFEEVSDKAIVARNAGMLTVVFATAAAMIGILHLFWLIYIGALVTLWPFAYDVYTPGGGSK